MFYPKLTRRENYKTKKNGEWYSSNRYYRKEILVDCQYRCVYCDITKSEIGGDDFLQLDHFRPQSLFPELGNNPTNLVAACPVCNRNKSNHWPVGKDVKESYSGQVGFIDPFEEESTSYFHITAKGFIEPLKPPAEYIIKILRLNRDGSVYKRKARMLSKELYFLASKAKNKRGPHVHRKICELIRNSEI